MSTFTRLFDHSINPEIIIVSGLPRSGTSLMMKMLEAGGLPPLTDGERAADSDNPRGYYEFERVKQLPDGDHAWLDQARGKAIKIISSLLQHLPPGYHYRVIFMRRALAEVLASQRAMLVRRGVANPEQDAEMERIFRTHLAATEAWLAARPNFQTLYVDYNQLLSEPDGLVADLVDFLPSTLDASRMKAVIDPALYRQRAHQV